MNLIAFILGVYIAGRTYSWRKRRRPVLKWRGDTWDVAKNQLKFYLEHEMIDPHDYYELRIEREGIDYECYRHVGTPNTLVTTMADDYRYVGSTVTCTLRKAKLGGLIRKPEYHLEDEADRH